MFLNLFFSHHIHQKPKLTKFKSTNHKNRNEWQNKAIYSPNDFEKYRKTQFVDFLLTQKQKKFVDTEVRTFVKSLAGSDASNAGKHLRLTPRNFNQINSVS